LVATAYRHGGKGEQAEEFLIWNGMRISAMGMETLADFSPSGFPVSIYYAF